MVDAALVETRSVGTRRRAALGALAAGAPRSSISWIFLRFCNPLGVGFGVGFGFAAFATGACRAAEPAAVVVLDFFFGGDAAATAPCQPPSGHHARADERVTGHAGQHTYERTHAARALSFGGLTLRLRCAFAAARAFAALASAAALSALWASRFCKAVFFGGGLGALVLTACLRRKVSFHRLTMAAANTAASAGATAPHGALGWTQCAIHAMNHPWTACGRARWGVQAGLDPLSHRDPFLRPF